MSLRKHARQLVIQMLYQIDLNPDITGREVRLMIDEHGRNTTTRSFAWQLFTGVMEFKPQIDAEIVRVAENWSLKRMAVTDRNILRLGAYELLHTDTPTAVVIDEAIELARQFGSANSSQFVNGILDKLVPRAENQASSTEASPALPAKEERVEPAADQPQEQKSPQEKMQPKPPSNTPYRKLNNPWAT
tara:strand:+ start:505 stop:1071 length:567 start_codon:yes stop_codon:yes gene_type:complete